MTCYRIFEISLELKAQYGCADETYLGGGLGTSDDEIQGSFTAFRMTTTTVDEDHNSSG